MIPSGHMTSIASAHPGEGSSSVAVLKVSSPYFPCESFFSISWEFLLIWCEVKGQGCRMCTDCKALWGKFVICDVGLYKINWIETSHRLEFSTNFLRPVCQSRVTRSRFMMEAVTDPPLTNMNTLEFSRATTPCNHSRVFKPWMNWNRGRIKQTCQQWKW